MTTTTKISTAADEQLDGLKKQFGLPKKTLLEIAIAQAAQRWPAEGLTIPGLSIVPRDPCAGFLDRFTNAPVPMDGKPAAPKVQSLETHEEPRA